MNSTIQFTCPQCSHTMQLPASTEGMQGKCPSCAAVITVTAQPIGELEVHDVQQQQPELIEKAVTHGEKREWFDPRGWKRREKGLLLAGSTLVLLAFLLVSFDGNEEGIIAYTRDDPKAIAALEALGGDIKTDGSGKVSSVGLPDSKVTDEDLVHLKGFSRMTLLGLANAQITDAGLVHLSGLKNLQRLYLDQNQITDQGVEHLKGLTRVEWLFLSHTQIGDQGLNHLKSLKTVGILRLDHTQITDAGLLHLKELPNLSILSLTGTKVTDAGVAELQKALPNCSISR